MFQNPAGGSEQLAPAGVKRNALGRARIRLQFEELEQRTLLSVAPVGGEFHVNTYTPNNQLLPNVASDSAGDYVVVWESYKQNGAVYGIYAQRYNAVGARQGGEFQVNTYTGGNDSAPSVAMDSAGDFVVAWTSGGQEGQNLYGVFARRYNAAGVAQGGEFQVNTYTTFIQDTPSVAMDSAGDFVVVWNSFVQDSYGEGVFAQLYNAAGVAQGGEFRVNTYTTSDQSVPSVAMDSAGDFLVAWQSYGQDGSNYGVYAQLYNAAGVVQGGEFRVNTYTTNSQRVPSVAMDSAGDFLVAWQSYGQDGSIYGVYAQRYNAAGVVQGGEFRVNTYTTSPEIYPSVAMDSAGDFLVAWQSYGQDGSIYGVYAQRYNATGVVQGGEFRVNTYTPSPEAYPSVAMDSAGDFVVAWIDSNHFNNQNVIQNDISQGIYAQRYAVTPSSVVSRDLFYAGSAYDKTGTALPFTPLPFSDDNAIASDKSAYLPGSGAATFANISSYAQGINGIMVDLDSNGGSHNSITLSNILNDFSFKVGNNNSPGSWSPGPSPTSVLVRTGAGGAGSDRIELIWPSGAITQKWLEVTVKATANTGLTANDVFFFGSEIGDSGASNISTVFKVGAADTTQTQTHLATIGTNVPITNIYDFNRDGQVGSGDITLAQTHGTTNSTGLVAINIAASGPFAALPPGSGGDGDGRAQVSTFTRPTVTSAVSFATNAATSTLASQPAAFLVEQQTITSAIATSSINQITSHPPIPASIANRLGNLDLNHGTVAKYFEHLAHENSPKSRAILVKADHIAEVLNLDDELLDGLLVRRGLG